MTTEIEALRQRVKNALKPCPWHGVDGQPHGFMYCSQCERLRAGKLVVSPTLLATVLGMNAIDDDDDENDSTLAESIATTTIDRQPSAQIGDWQYHLDDAEAVLAMPQFEAIRNALRWAHAYYGDGYLDHDMRLPDDVIAWVLS